MPLIGLRARVAFYALAVTSPPHRAGTDRNVQILQWLFINKWQYDVSVSNRRRRHCVRLSFLPASGARLRSIIRVARDAGAEANAEGSRAAVVRVARCNVFFLYFFFLLSIFEPRVAYASGPSSYARAGFNVTTYRFNVTAAASKGVRNMG